jgi:hypothetical protein
MFCSCRISSLENPSREHSDVLSEFPVPVLGLVAVSPGFVLVSLAGLSLVPGAGR